MIRSSPTTKSPRPRSVKARARRLAEILAECSQGILPGDYSEAGISDFAAELRQFYSPPTKATRQPRAPSISKMIEQAKQAGASVTLPDGTKLDFTKATDATADDEVENWLRKQKGH